MSLTRCDATHCDTVTYPQSGYTNDPRSGYSALVFIYMYFDFHGLQATSESEAYKINKEITYLNLTTNYKNVIDSSSVNCFENALDKITKTTMGFFGD